MIFYILPLHFFFKIGTFKVVPLIGCFNKSKKFWCFLVLYLGEPQTTGNCIKFLKSPKSTHPTVYTLHKTLCTQQLVPHAADRCAVILFPAFWGNNPWNKDEGRLLFILYLYIHILCVQPNKMNNPK